MKEPLQLKNVVSMQQQNLRNSISLMETGEALVCTFKSPKALFFGYIPRQMCVIWKYPDIDQLYVQKNGYTFFTWSHSCEALVLTGLVTHVYEVYDFDVEITFNIFNPIKFITLTSVELFNEKIEMFLAEMFNNWRSPELFTTPEFYKYMADKFTEANTIFQPLGVAINAIDPPGFNE